MRRYRPWSERRRRRFEAKQAEKLRRVKLAEELEEMEQVLVRRDLEQLAEDTNINLVPVDDSPMGSFVYDLLEQQEPLDTALHVKKVPEPTNSKSRMEDLVLPFMTERTTHGISDDNLPWWHR